MARLPRAGGIFAPSIGLVVTREDGVTLNSAQPLHIGSDEQEADCLSILELADPELARPLRAESRRQRETIELIASENHASAAVRAAQGTVLTNKYAEGYPGRRYYGGCAHVDEVERLAIQRCKQLFHCEHANVQPHSGSQANAAAYMSVLDIGDTVLAMSLAHGGHLTHGHRLSFSGREYRFVPYGVDRETERIDYEALEALAKRERPKMIVAGASAYARIIDFARLRAIADDVGALLMVDMAHIAGLVATGVHPSPIPHADLVTSTTHKTLRGPRGGLALSKRPYARALDRAVFPGIQGGPLMHVIAAKAVAFLEAMEPGFVGYQQAVVRNAKALGAGLMDAGYRLVSGGTDNHMLLVDVGVRDITGADAEQWLERAGIACNKNMIPFDPRPPRVTSGIRLGTPAATTRGMGIAEMARIAKWIARVLDARGEADVVAQVRRETRELARAFPLA
ncbi:MAG: serine hydroxymethyltransferase [Anaerolineae bacterium]|nr:serine hydroxymethyltransferase [Anaerolineae bacterium]